MTPKRAARRTGASRSGCANYTDYSAKVPRERVPWQGMKSLQLLVLGSLSLVGCSSSLDDGERSGTAGSMVARWNGRDALGRDVPAGIYFVRLTSGAAARRFVWLR